MALHVGTTGPPIRANQMEPEVLRQITNSLLRGRVGVVNDTDFTVSQHAGTANMSVDVSAGFAFVPGLNQSPVQGSYHVYNDGVVNVPIATANGTFPRVDLILLTVLDAFYGSASNTAVLQAVTGVATASPAVPAIPATAANSIVLAHVYVPALAGTIVNSNINGTAGTNNPDAASAYRAPRATNNPYTWSAYQNSIQSNLSNATPTIIRYDSTLWNPIAGAYNTSTWQYNVQVGGIYFFNAAMRMATTTATASAAYLELFWNGTAFMAGAQTPLQANTFPSWATDGIVICSAGDTLDMRFVHNSSTNNLSTAAGLTQTYFQGILLAPF